MKLPPFHETGLHPRDVISLTEIARLAADPERAHWTFGYDALRSYATGRRTHPWFGVMPDPVARIANRRLWMRTQIEQWIAPPHPRTPRNRLARERFKSQREAIVRSWRT